MDAHRSVDDYERVDEWADAMLEQHRDEPSDSGQPWFNRDLPRVQAFLEAVQAIALIPLALGASRPSPSPSTAARR